jgi:hypothetical protein
MTPTLNSRWRDRNSGAVYEVIEITELYGLYTVRQISMGEEETERVRAEWDRDVAYGHTDHSLEEYMESYLGFELPVDLKWFEIVGEKL